MLCADCYKFKQSYDFYKEKWYDNGHGLFDFGGVENGKITTKINSKKPGEIIKYGNPLSNRL